jgi:DDE superfamily endonuclease
MAEWHLPPELMLWIAQLAQPLHARVRGRLLPLLVGLLFARGRKTVASWLRAAGLGKDFRAYYYFLSSLGRNSKWVAARLLRLAVSVIVPGDRLLFALDDSPTKRAGPQIEGAGIHHNPTPGAADQKFLYGHVWVTLAWVVRHPIWGTIGLPLLALLYVRRKDMAKLPRWYKVTFRTKLEMAAELVAWLVTWLARLGKKVWVVTDGAYAKRPFLKKALASGVVVVSRLRKDAALWSVPTPVATSTRRPRGRPRTYGSESISLAKRAGHKRGWQSGAFVLYNQKVTKKYKTFLATYKPVGGLIRVLLVQEERGWVAYFCTDPQAPVERILEAVADRAAIEQDFHDLKEVHGTGQQQLRNYWANIGAYHLTLWWHTLVELWAWHKPQGQLCDRSASPWDDATRRPSHADRHNALRRRCLHEEFRNLPKRGPGMRKMRRVVRCLLRLIG